MRHLIINAVGTIVGSFLDSYNRILSSLFPRQFLGGVMLSKNIGAHDDDDVSGIMEFQDIVPKNEQKNEGVVDPEEKPEWDYEYEAKIAKAVLKLFRNDDPVEDPDELVTYTVYLKCSAAQGYKEEEYEEWYKSFIPKVPHDTHPRKTPRMFYT